MGRPTLPGDVDDRVVQGLYEAAAGIRPWKDAMESLDAAVGAYCSQMVVIEKKNGRLIRSEQPDETPADAVMDYVREYHRIDPHTKHLTGASMGDVLHTADLFPAVTYADHPFYKDFWLPYNVRSFVGAKVGEDDRSVAIMAILRSFDHPAFGKHEVALIGRYLKHLVVAMRIAGYLQRVHSVASAGHGLMEGSGRPMILLDHRRAILAANGPARALLSDGTIIFAEDECLRCRSRQAETSLVATMADLACRSDEKCNSMVRRKAITLLARGPSRVLCSVWDLTPGSAMGAFGPYRSLLLTVAVRGTSMEGDPMLIASMFDLTPAEARIGAALMNGQSLQVIAKSFRVSLLTVRSHLKSIFVKTNTHRQAELVSLLRDVATL